MKSLLVLAPALWACTNPSIPDPEQRLLPLPPSRVSPKPLSGGTLLVVQGGTRAIAADPHRDLLWYVDLNAHRLDRRVKLKRGDEPGRLVEDDQGRVHVALRSGGAVVSLSPDGLELARREVCSTPRGIAYDASDDVLYVACLTGELVVLPAEPSLPKRSAVLIGTDLRDVIVRGELLWISTFKTAEVLWVNKRTWAVVQRTSLETDESGIPGVAWRMTPDPTGGAWLLHERARDTATEPIDLSPAGAGHGSAYGAPPPIPIPEEPEPEPIPECQQPLVRTALTHFDAQGNIDRSTLLARSPLTIDFAVSPSGERAVAAVAGRSRLTNETEVGAGQVSYFNDLRFDSPDGCSQPAPQPPRDMQVSAVAYDDQNRAIAFSHNPPLMLVAGQDPIELKGGLITDDLGHLAFHTATEAGIACASCHPEGHEDGRVWHFVIRGPRRTQSLRVNLLETTPLHWDGEFIIPEDLLGEVYARRMGGHLDTDLMIAFVNWLGTVEPLPQSPPAIPEQSARGEQLFHDELGCIGCHSGPNLTNNQAAQLNNRRFQIPSLLGIRYRAPYLHDGSAPSLEARFSTEDRPHNLSELPPDDLAALVGYLNTL